MYTNCGGGCTSKTECGHGGDCNESLIEEISILVLSPIQSPVRDIPKEEHIFRNHSVKRENSTPLLPATPLRIQSKRKPRPEPIMLTKIQADKLLGLKSQFENKDSLLSRKPDSRSTLDSSRGEHSFKKQEVGLGSSQRAKDLSYKASIHVLKNNKGFKRLSRARSLLITESKNKLSAEKEERDRRRDAGEDIMPELLDMCWAGLDKF